MKLSRRTIQILSYISGLIIALLCGTPYLFSAYATSIADRLGFSSVQINTIGSIANYGLYLSTPLFGHIADHYPSRITPMLAAVTTFIGYFCLAMTYQGYFESKSVLLCAFYLFLPGIASAAAYLSLLVTIRSNIKSFRGIAFGAPFALFALSAFMFSQINSFFFKDDTYHFLLFLAITTGTFMFAGSIFLIRLPPEESHDEILTIPELSDEEERVPLLSEQRQRNEEIDIGGWEFLKNTDAMLFGSIMFLIGGIGLMYINNVGMICKLLYLSSSTLIDEESKHSSKEGIQHFQNLHVTLISISSCLGRLCVGCLSDFVKYKYNLRRLWFLLATCFYVFIGQILVGFIIKDLNYLWIGTIFIGFGYGNLFVITSTMVSEWFGSRSFGLNWGIMASFIAFGGQLFNLLFGFNLDLNVNNCSGSNCYINVFYISTISCIICMCIVTSLLLRGRERLS